MNTGRFRQSMAVVILVALFALGRVVTSSNPVYDLIEPIVQVAGRLTRPLVISSAQPVESDQEQWQLERQLLRHENEQLRLQLAAANTNRSTLAANITLRDVYGFDKTIWLDKGTQDGVEIGDIVLFEQTLFGQISQVYDTSAAAQLIIDPDFTMTVTVGDGLHGLLKIDHGSVVVDLLPSKDQFDQLIFSDGLDGRIPAGIAAGQLAQEIGQTGDVFGMYYVRLPYNPYDVTQVTIISSKGDAI